MNNQFHMLDVVALTRDLPEKNLFRGQVGTIVEELPAGVHEVEFCDNQGRTYASIALPASELLLLHYEPVKAA